MSIVNPLVSPNPSVAVQSSTSPVATTEERQLDLRLEQMVRATVVEGGLDRALLEMNHRHYRAQSDIELQVGQKLTLQVLQTHPTLELRVLNDPLGGRLSQLLPLLMQPYDWTKLLDGLRQQPQPQNLPTATTQVYQQLQQLLQPNGQLPAALETSLGKLPVQLRQLFIAFTGGQNGADRAGAAQQGQQATQAHVVYQGNAALLPNLPQLIRALHAQLTQLQNSVGRPLPQIWQDETRQLLAPLPQNLIRLQPQNPQLNNLFTLLGQMRQQPSLPPQVAAELDRLLISQNLQGGRELPAAARVPLQAGGQVTTAPSTAPATTVNVGPPGGPTAQPTSPVATPAAAGQVPSGTASSAGGTPAATSSQASTQPVVPPPTEISVGLEKLLSQVQQAQGGTGRLSPELLGRLEGLIDKLQQFPQGAQTAQPLLPGLELMTSQLTQLTQQGVQRPEGGQLGFLSQLFGFNLETELLKGKKKEALASLKLSLLTMQKELGPQADEPLRRLEMFQLCKARLAEEQVQFLPLPFNELEEGYLFVEKQSQSDDKEGDEAATQLSLSLRLSALGNMRVDMLYDKQGLRLRVACEDNEKMGYLQEHSAALEEAIETVPLRGVSFSADAKVPARQLLERLLPEALGMLDARI